MKNDLPTSDLMMCAIIQLNVVVKLVTLKGMAENSYWPLSMQKLLVHMQLIYPI